jgi:ABC-type multidrug transport system fused ATPase/permease subunit
MRYYRTASKSLKRTEALSRSPTLSHVAETLSGLAFIRSMGLQKVYAATNAALLDDTTSASRARKAMDRWLCVQLELLGNLVVLSAALLAVAMGSKAGAAGLSISNALVLTGLLNWAVRNLADMEALIGSVERVIDTIDRTRNEYSGTTNEHTSASGDGVVRIVPSPKAVATNGKSKFVSSFNATSGGKNVVWPRTGSISFSNVSLRYVDDEFSSDNRPTKSFGSVLLHPDGSFTQSKRFMPPSSKRVLDNISFNISHGQHVAIVGRTGSGKRCDC